VTALRSHTLGKEPDKHLDPTLIADFGDQGPFEVLGRNMLFLDPPDHTRLRSLVREGFSNRAVETLAPRIAAIVDELVDRIGDRPDFDLIADFALPLPVTVIAEMLGIPSADQHRFRDWTDHFLGRVGNPEESMTAAMEFIQYLNDLAEARRTDPRDDLISFLLHAEEDGERLDHQEFLAMIFLLLIAGHETTVNLIGNGTLELIRHQGEFTRLLDGEVTVESATEELLRFHGPVESTTIRWAYDDVEIGGVDLQAGSLVIPILMGANRDPEVFDDPDMLDLGRSPNRHLAFGSGIHLCLGAPLARREAHLAFGALRDRLGRLELDMEESELQWTEGFFLRGARTIEVRRCA
jgi:cytochrome P450